MKILTPNLHIIIRKFQENLKWLMKSSTVVYIYNYR